MTRSFCRDLCYQAIQQEALAAAWVLYPPCRPAVEVLDLVWTIQYVKSLR